jgi:sugar porter (SP) family MFS transporter
MDMTPAELAAQNTTHRRRARLAIALGALGFLLFGYDTGVIAGALLFIKKDMHLTPSMTAWVVSILLAGATIGAVLSGRLVERIGHRRLLIGAGVLFTFGAGMAALSSSFLMLVLARFIIGVAVGTSSAQVMLYVTEISPTATRGGLATLAPMTGTTGILISYFVDYALSGSGAWRWMFGVAIIPSLLLIIGMLFAPDSPRWLVKRNRVQDALETLRLTLPEADAQHQLAEIQGVASSAPSAGFTAIFADPALRGALLIACGLAVLQQIVGINTVIYYAPTILRNIGFGASDAILTTACLQFLAIMATLVASRLVDRHGRRPLLMFGAVAMGISLCAIGAIMQTALATTTTGHVIAVAALAFYKMAFSFSWGPLVWVMMPEVLPLRARGTGMGISSLCNWASNFAVSFSFPLLLAVSAKLVFGVFVGGCVLAFLYTKFVLRETAQRSLERIEIEDLAEPVLSNYSH